VGRRGTALDDVGRLLHAAGNDDSDAFAAFYDRTSPVVFRILCCAFEDSVAAERAMVRVYVRVWRSASSFDPAQMSGGAFLMQAVSREFHGRDRSWRAGSTQSRRPRR
jgi:RNA polymerase sigma-70 factor (ECF subfamily)